MDVTTTLAAVMVNGRSPLQEISREVAAVHGFESSIDGGGGKDVIIVFP
jgi:hypothetical protein